jgi:hypothetical protein
MSKPHPNLPRRLIYPTTLRPTRLLILAIAITAFLSLTLITTHLLRTPDRLPPPISVVTDPGKLHGKGPWSFQGRPIDDVDGQDGGAGSEGVGEEDGGEGMTDENVPREERARADSGPGMEMDTEMKIRPIPRHIFNQPTNNHNGHDVHNHDRPYNHNHNHNHHHDISDSPKDSEGTIPPGKRDVLSTTTEQRVFTDFVRQTVYVHNSACGSSTTATVTVSASTPNGVGLIGHSVPYRDDDGDDQLRRNGDGRVADGFAGG